MKRSALLLLAAVAALTGCGGTDTLEIQVFRTGCRTTETDLLRAVSTVRVRITGDGMDPIEAEGTPDGGSVELPVIPPGENRVIEVRGISRGGNTTVIGRSQPFLVEDSGAEAESVRILMRPVEGTVPTATDDNACTGMRVPRAAHATVRLPDGRALLIGGFSAWDGRNKWGTGYLSSTEIYDPATGTFSEGPELVIDGSPVPMAYPQAVVLDDGRVLVAGGEIQDGQLPIAALDAYVLSADLRTWSVIDGFKGVRGAAYFKVNDGRVIVAGGRDERDALLSDVQVFDPATNTWSAGPALNTARVYPAFTVLSSFANQGTQTLAVIGGGDSDTTVAATWETLQVGASRWDEDPMDVGVIGGAAVNIAGIAYVFGGATEWNGAAPGQNFDNAPVGVQQGNAGSRLRRSAQDGPNGIFPCGIAYGTNRFVGIGGFNATTFTGNGFQRAMEVVSGTPQALQQNPVALTSAGGGGAACVDLGGGQILVTGGIGATDATDGAEIFTYLTR